MLDHVDEHWSGEHHGNDNPLFAELDEAIDRLRSSPRVGMVFRRGAGGREIRRLLLRSGWHLYYRYQPTLSLIEIVAVWYAGRGEGPPL
jgi:plasmid stabilization system protein ParE